MSEDKDLAVSRIEDALVGNFDGDWSGGLRRFSNVSVGELIGAIEAAPELADITRWNNFIGLPMLLIEAGKLMEQGLDVHFIGYVVGQGRTDARLSVEGLCASTPVGDSKTLTLAALRGANLGADEFEIRGDQVIWWWD
jgi:hypothetical protein